MGYYDTNPTPFPRNPTVPTFDPGGDANSGGGAVDWLKGKFSDVSAGDVLHTAGSVVGGIFDARAKAKQLAEQKREFERIQQMREAQSAVGAETAINKLPLADKSQALLMARMGAAPTAFHPRDYTQGVAGLSGHATGGPQDSLAAGQRAAAAYRPGAGGVSSEVLRQFLAKMQSASGMGTSATPPMPNMDPNQYIEYLKRQQQQPPISPQNPWDQ